MDINNNYFHLDISEDHHSIRAYYLRAPCVQKTLDRSDNPDSHAYRHIYLNIRFRLVVSIPIKVRKSAREYRHLVTVKVDEVVLDKRLL